MEKIFPVGTPVYGKDLIGRDQEIKKLLDLIKIGQNISIISPRRFGKTSILLELISRLKKDYFFIFIDMFKISSKKELAYEIINQVFKNKKINKFTNDIKEKLISLIKNMEIKQTIEDFEFTVKLVDEKDEDILLNEALHLPDKFANKYNKSMICIFDEFGDIVKLDGLELQKKLRSIFQLSKNSIYIFSGSQETVLNKIFKDNSSPFYNFSRIILLDVLPEKELVDYIIKRFKSLNLMISNPLAKELIGKVTRHPYYTQLLCQQIYLQIKHEKKVITSDDISDSFIQILNLERNYLELLWGKIKSRKDFAQIIKFLIENPNPYKLMNFQRQQIFYIIIELEKMGIIKKIKKGRYYIIDPLLYQFVKEIIV